MGYTEITTALKGTPIFESLTEDETAALAEACRIVHRAEGEILFREGEPATHFFVLLSGQIQAYKISGEGKEMILHLFNSGDMFAEFPVFSDSKCYPVNTLCLRDSRLLSIEGEHFYQLAKSKPEILLKMLLRLSDRLRYFTSVVEDLSLRNVDARLAKYLLSVSNADSPEANIEIHKKTLASILGTVPETLSRSFKKLCLENLILLKGNTVQILNRPELIKLADILD